MKRILFVLLVAACGGKSSKPSEAPAPAQPDPTPAAPAPTEPVAQTPPAEPPPPPPPKEAKAELAPTTKPTKSKAKGTVTFKEVDGGVEITATLEGLKAGDHAWHIHEKGDCSAPDASSAGEHFNPTNMKHGGPDAEEHHAGDFGNLQADKTGKATKTFVMKGITIADGAASIVGKGFIVHDKKDDLKTQPSGNAGGRIACGVIELVK